MKNPFKEFLYFSKTERRGILVLVTAIILLLLFNHFYRYRQAHATPTEAEIEQQAEEVAEYERFLASVRLKEQPKEKNLPADHKGNSSPLLFFFDPNSADSTTFRQLGLPAWMAQNILRYREKGGRFRQAEDFKKIYGLREADYQRLLPYICIAGEESINDKPQPLTTLLQSDSATQIEKRAEIYNRAERNDSAKIGHTFLPKYPKGTIIELNRADTTELQRIPGIGSAIARMIVGYRKRLGGFYCIEQLEEIHLDYRQLEPWFRINPNEISRINVNLVGIEKLRNHPYINFYQAKILIDERNQAGKLRNLNMLSLYDEFSEEDLERISHYICFE